MYLDRVAAVIAFIIFFFFNDTATTEIYTLSLHDALPSSTCTPRSRRWARPCSAPRRASPASTRSEEHTSELQSPDHLVCRLLLEKKKSEYHRLRRLRNCRRYQRSTWQLLDRR